MLLPALPRPRVRPALAALLAVGLAATAGAQFPVQHSTGDAAGDFHGQALAAAGDVDLDGVVDLVVGTPKHDAGAVNAGRARVYSGADGTVLLTIDGDAVGQQFGFAVAGAGDVNADGFADVIVGAPFSSAGAQLAGEARVVSGKDGALLHRFLGGTGFGLFGYSVAGAGDVDGDGRDDVLVGAPQEDGNGPDSGTVRVFSGATGGVLYTYDGDGAGDELGFALAGGVDASGDGRPDFALGAHHADAAGVDSGTVRLYSGLDGSVLHTWHGAAAGDELGYALAFAGDHDGDGRADLALGAPYASAEAGAVRLVSSASGAALHVFPGAAGERLGAALARCGDVDGDGAEDVLAGAPKAGGVGAARVYSGASRSVLFELAGLSAGADLGRGLAGGFDWTGEGAAEFAVGAPFDDGAATDAGRVDVWSAVNDLYAVVCAGDGSGAFCPCGNLGASGEGCANSTGVGAVLGAEGSRLVASDDLVLRASQARPDKSGLFLQGGTALQSAFRDGLLCVGNPTERLELVQLDASGAASSSVSLVTEGGIGAGTTAWYQLWYRDGMGPCATGSNLSNAIRVEWK